jgi:hypothetical protein
VEECDGGALQAAKVRNSIEQAVLDIPALLGRKAN